MTDSLKQESFLTIIMLAVQADRVFSLEEKEVIKSTVLELEIFKNYSQKQIIEKMEQALKKIETKGEEVSLQEATRNLPKELYQTVFTTAADLIASDRQITNNERDILQRLQQTLSIPQITVNKIIS